MRQTRNLELFKRFGAAARPTIELQGHAFAQGPLVNHVRHVHSPSRSLVLRKTADGKMEGHGSPRRKERCEVRRGGGEEGVSPSSAPLRRSTARGGGARACEYLGCPPPLHREKIESCAAVPFRRTVSTTSASPRSPRRSAAPVPTATTRTAMPVGARPVTRISIPSGRSLPNRRSPS